MNFYFDSDEEGEGRRSTRSSTISLSDDEEEDELGETNIPPQTTTGEEEEGNGQDGLKDTALISGSGEEELMGGSRILLPTTSNQSNIDPSNKQDNSGGVKRKSLQNGNESRSTGSFSNRRKRVKYQIDPRQFDLDLECERKLLSLRNEQIIYQFKNVELNESIALARKRLKDSGISEAERNQLLPIPPTNIAAIPPFEDLHLLRYFGTANATSKEYDWSQFLDLMKLDFPGLMYASISLKQALDPFSEPITLLKLKRKLLYQTLEQYLHPFRLSFGDFDALKKEYQFRLAGRPPPNPPVPNLSNIGFGCFYYGFLDLAKAMVNAGLYRRHSTNAESTEVMRLPPMESVDHLLLSHSAKNALSRCEILLQFEANPCFYADDWSPLMLVSANNNLPICKLFLDAGASPVSSNSKGVSPLHFAALNGHFEICQLLVERGANVNQASKEMSTPLTLTSEKGHLTIVKFLINKKANVNFEGPRKMQALHFACLRGQKEVASALLDNGAALDSIDSDGKTPLFYSITFGQIDLVTMLVSQGASLSLMNTMGESILHEASKRGKIDIVKYIINKTGTLLLNRKDNRGLTPVQLAIQAPHQEVASFLADLNTIQHNQSSG